MSSKYIVLLVVVVFLLGLSSWGLCFPVKPSLVYKCCASKAAHLPSDSENCLSHCEKQRVDIIKTNDYFNDDIKTKIESLENNGYSIFLQNFSFKQKFIPQHYYPSQVIPTLRINQIYFAAIFNHAPPLAYNSFLSHQIY